MCRIQPAISLMGGLSILVAAYGTSAESGRLDSVGRIRHNLGVSDRSSECIVCNEITPIIISGRAAHGLHPSTRAYRRGRKNDHAASRH